MTFQKGIPFIANNMKKIHTIKPIFHELSLTYYENKNNGFKLLFRKYKAKDVNNIYYLSLIEYWKENTDKTDYEINKNRVYKPSKKRELDRNVD